VVLTLTPFLVNTPSVTVSHWVWKLPHDWS